MNTSHDKWQYLVELEEELLQGGVILSEWTTFLVKDAQIAFCAGAYLSSILASQSAIESHLKYDVFSSDESKKWGFYQLIENSSFGSGFKEELHELRKLRNLWVHVSDPQDDHDLLNRPEYHEQELKQFAIRTMRTVLTVIYNNPWI